VKPTKTPSNHPKRGIQPITKSQFDLEHYQLVEDSLNITKDINQQGVKFEIIATGKNGKKYAYGSVSVPAHLIPVGWSVEISRVEHSDLEKPKPSTNCEGSDNDNTLKSQIVSLAFDLIIRDQHGRQRSLEALLKGENESKGLELELSYLLENHEKDGNQLRMGYLGDGDSSWKYLDDKPSTVSDVFGRKKGTTNHLTSNFGLIALSLV